jgi:cell division protein FtsB
MLGNLKALLDNKKVKQLTDTRNVALYIFGIVVLAITWSGVKTIQANYELQKKIAVLKQQNTVLQLQNQNVDLQNKFYQTNEYLDLAARQDLGLAAPGEKVLIVPKTTAFKYVDPSLGQSTVKTTQASVDTRPNYVKNLEAWRDFLLGRKLLDS